MIEVLLLESMKTLGQAGEVVKVSEGYARNFLFPRKLAMVANKGAVEMAKGIAKSREKEKQKITEEAQALRDRLQALECQISMKVGQQDQLFGAVTSTHIAEALQKAGVSIDRRKIVLSEPIKTLGEFSVAVKLHPEVEAALKVSVIKQN